MAVWAHACRTCGTEEDPANIYVSAAAVAEMPPGTRILQVRIGEQWHCAIVDRTRRIDVDRMLLHDAVPAQPGECPGCDDHGRESGTTVPGTPAAGHGDDSSSGSVQAAAIALRGHHLVVVLVSPQLLDSPGEADMALDALEKRFGGTPTLLMAQRDDGSPRYYGDPVLGALLEGVPIEKMPWKTYPLG